MLLSLLIFLLCSLSSEALARQGVTVANIKLVDVDDVPIEGVKLGAYLPGEKEPVAVVQTDKEGAAAFIGILNDQEEYFFAALLSEDDMKTSQLGAKALYVDHAYGKNYLTLYFVTMPYKITSSYYGKKFVIQPGKYVDFFDIAQKSVDFRLSQKEKRFVLRIRSLPGSNVVRVFMPMHYEYEVQAMYSQGFGAGEVFYATPGLNIMVR